MPNLGSKNLLIVAPHFRFFIKDQTVTMRSNLRKISVLVPKPYFTSLALKLPYLKGKFAHLKWISETDNVNSEIEVSPVRFFGIPVPPIEKRIYHLIAQNVLKIINKKEIELDLIHSHFLYQGYVGLILKTLKNIPLILTTHGGDVYDTPFRNRFFLNLAKYILREVDHVIAVSRFIAGKLVKLWGVQNKLSIIPNGYRKELFYPIPIKDARTRVALPLRKKILVSIGGLVPVKGHDVLIKAMAKVTEKRKDVLLVIIGSGPLMNRLKKKTSDLNLQKYILFIGTKKHDEIALWINASNLVVLPSLNEGFGTVITEAMACGKAVIASRVGGVPEVISNYELGILVEPRNSYQLAAAILQALERRWNEKEIVDHAKRYSWSNITKRILGIYERLL